ncbi:MAG: hypothetical protein JNJ54_36385 [Myxococcaceae bacterium]|nr:hypothetical protein [Myxococcaceae bacterium]
MSRQLTSVERAFIAVERKLAKLTRGYFISFDEELVRQRGIAGFFRWGAQTDKVMNELIASFGETRFHLVAAFASLWNGCDYCAYGHILALNLCLYRDTQTLFPIGEHEVHELLRLRDVELKVLLEQRIGRSHPDFVKLVGRLSELRFADGPLQGEDKVLVKAIALYEWINECSITVDSPAPPLGPVSKDLALAERYREARAQQRQAQAATTPPTS